MKKLLAFFEKDEKIAHLTSFFKKAQDLRNPIVRLLDECAQQNVTQPEQCIKLLEEYLPTLELVIDGIQKNTVNLQGYLEVVWTTFLMSDINAKSISSQLQWERVCCYLLLGLSYYQIAIKSHHENRQTSHDQLENEKKEHHDPIFDAPQPIEEPKIVDDQEKVKIISQNLKKAASVWNFVATKLYPVEVGKEFDVIPETFRDVAQCLSTTAQVNAQEFMVQLAVQTGKSTTLTSKLSMGISKQLKEADARLISNLSPQIYNIILHDFRLYMKIRSDLYKAIAQKYYGKMSKSQEKKWRMYSIF